MQQIKTIDRVFYRELGKKLRMIREKRNLTLKEVAHEMGYARSLIDLWELGVCKIKPFQLDKLCDVYNISNNLSVNVKIGFLLEGED